MERDRKGEGEEEQEGEDETEDNDVIILRMIKHETLRKPGLRILIISIINQYNFVY